jgi:hypothetical protein
MQQQVVLATDAESGKTCASSGDVPGMEPAEASAGMPGRRAPVQAGTQDRFDLENGTHRGRLARPPERAGTALRLLRMISLTTGNVDRSVRNSVSFTH